MLQWRFLKGKSWVYQCPKLVLHHRLYIFLCIYYLLLTIPRSCRNFIKVVYVYYSTHYNAYTTLQITISHYIILFYNTLLRTVRIQIHYCFPGCSYCSCYFYFLYYYNVSGFPERFPVKKGPKDCQITGSSHVLTVNRSVWVSKEYSIFLLYLVLLSNERFRLGILIGWVMKKFLDLEKYLLWA